MALLDASPPAPANTRGDLICSLLALSGFWLMLGAVIWVAFLQGWSA